MKDSNEPNWVKAKRAETQKFNDMKVFQEVPIPEGVKPITTRRVFTYTKDYLKGDAYKARCVVQGFEQREGVDYDPTKILASVIDLASIRLLTAIAVEKNMIIHHVDIKSAYLNAVLTNESPSYVFPPPGYNKDNTKCWLLDKAVYGLKQSGYEWLITFISIFKKLGFTQNEHQDNIFVDIVQVQVSSTFIIDLMDFHFAAINSNSNFFTEQFD